MEDVRLIVDIVIALGAATIGGFIAQRLGVPALIGYIVAGLVIGPNTPGSSPTRTGCNCWPTSVWSCSCSGSASSFP